MKLNNNDRGVCPPELRELARLPVPISSDNILHDGVRERAPRTPGRKVAPDTVEYVLCEKVLVVALVLVALAGVAYYFDLDLSALQRLILGGM